MKVFLIPLLAIVLQDSGCNDNRTEADRKADQATQTLTAESANQVGMPGITNFTEMKLARRLYELRDSKIATFAYVPDFQGRLWHLCDSIGYGLPYSVQFTNPLRPFWPTQHDTAMIPQPEPNGLFMPAGAEGTWIICAGPTGTEQPVYVEPRVIVSPFRLNASGEYQSK